MNIIAKFVGGPLEGQEMMVDTPTVRHMVTMFGSPMIRVYWYKKHTRIGTNVWSYVVDEITEESKYVS